MARASDVGGHSHVAAAGGVSFRLRSDTAARAAVLIRSVPAHGRSPDLDRSVALVEPYAAATLSPFSPTP